MQTLIVEYLPYTPRIYIFYNTHRITLFGCELITSTVRGGKTIRIYPSRLYFRNSFLSDLLFTKYANHLHIMFYFCLREYKIFFIDLRSINIYIYLSRFGFAMVVQRWHFEHKNGLRGDVKVRDATSDFDRAPKSVPHSSSNHNDI